MSPGYIFIIALWFPIVSTAAPKIWFKSYKITYCLSLCLHEDIYLGSIWKFLAVPLQWHDNCFDHFGFVIKFETPQPHAKSMVFLSIFSLWNDNWSILVMNATLHTVGKLLKECSRHNFCASLGKPFSTGNYLSFHYCRSHFRHRPFRSRSIDCMLGKKLSYFGFPLI